MRSRIVSTLVIGVALVIPGVNPSPRSDGLLVLASSLSDLVTVFVVVAAAVLIGASITRRDVMPVMPGSLAIVASLVVGSGVLGGWLIVQGLVGLFEPMAVVIGTLVLVFVCSGSNTVEFTRTTLRAARNELASIWSDRLGRIPMALALVGVVYLMFTALGPTTSWDGPMYHVDLPLEFLETGRVFLPPDNQHAAFVGSPQMLNGLFLASGAESGPALMQWVWFVALTGLIATTIRRWVTPLAGGLSLALVWTFPLLPILGSVDLVDMAMATAVFTGTLVALHWLEVGTQPSAVFLGALVGGIMVTKYQAGLYLLGIAGMVVVVAVASRAGIDVGSLGLAFLVALAVWAPVALKNVVLFGSPIFPFLSDPFVPAWAYEIDPFLDLGPQPSVLSEARDSFNLRDWVLDPGALTPEEIGAWFGLPVVFLLGVGGLFTSTASRLAMLATPAVVGVTVMTLVRDTTNLRYFVPVAPVAVMALTVFLGRLAQRVSWRAKGLLLAIILVFSSWAAGQWIGAVAVPSARASASIGTISHVEWLQRPANATERRAVILGEELRRLGASDTEPALLLYEGRGALIDTGVLQDNVFMNWPVLSEAVAVECPDDLSWSLLVRSTSTIDYLLNRGVDPGLLQLRRFDEFAERCLERVQTVEGYEVFRRSR